MIPKMSDDSLINSQSWSRAVEKIGYRDGASDGQDAVFQASFDIGYEMGFSYGFQIASHKTRFREINGSQELNSRETKLSNCQICLRRNLTDNIHNLSNFQKEENSKLLNLLKVNGDGSVLTVNDNKKYSKH